MNVERWVIAVLIVAVGVLFFIVLRPEPTVARTGSSHNNDDIMEKVRLEARLECLERLAHYEGPIPPRCN